MKRLSSFILIALLAVSIAGCDKQYQSERCLYKAAKLARHIIMAPDSIPPEEFNNAIKAYTIIFEKYPDSISAKRARLSIGSLYLAKKENIKALEVFNKALKLYPDDKSICIEARFSIAKSYEEMASWDRALTEYKGIMRDYPDTEIGLNLPMYIMQHYEKEKDIPGIDNAYREAIAYYKNIAEKNPRTMLGFRAQDFIIACHMKRENWQEAVNSMEKSVMDYPMVKTIPDTMRMISDISVNKLKDPNRAFEIFQKFLTAYPGHPIKEYIRKGLEVLKNVSPAK